MRKMAGLGCASGLLSGRLFGRDSRRSSQSNCSGVSDSSIFLQKITGLGRVSGFVYSFQGRYEGFVRPFLLLFYSGGRELFLRVSSRNRLGGESDDS